MVVIQNVREEISREIERHGGMQNVLCALVCSADSKEFKRILKVNHTAIQEAAFLEACDFSISIDYNTLKLEGMVLFKDRTWMIRDIDTDVPYEFWHFYRYPDVPDECKE